MPARRTSEFTIAIDGPYAAVAPLFGAERERAWAEGWAPRFVHPLPARDEPGAVFVVDGEPGTVWVTTVFDLERGHVQYVHFAEGLVVTRIDIRLESLGPRRTSAQVRYERTALRAEGLELLRRWADDDAGKAAHWQAELDAWCARHLAREA